MDPETVYNPLDKTNLAKSILNALLEAREVSLADLKKMPRDPGVYALYYKGDFEAYRPLALLNANEARYPIYVGKASPEGSRKGSAVAAGTSKKGLRSRLGNHASSIRRTPSLRIEDFSVRSLVVDEVWIDLGETVVIEYYSPVWNLVVEGFGSNGVGSGRYKGMRPAWDELHPGRLWAAKCEAPRASREEIVAKVAKHMDAYTVQMSASSSRADSIE
jgi:hypothetical protein